MGYVNYLSIHPFISFFLNLIQEIISYYINIIHILSHIKARSPGTTICMGNGLWESYVVLLFYSPTL